MNIKSKYIGQSSKLINKKLKSNNLILIKSYTGSGKTTYLLDLVKKNPTKKFLFVSVNITNAHQIVSSAMKIGVSVKPYLKMKEASTDRENKLSDIEYNSYFYKNINKFQNIAVNCLSLHRLLSNNNLKYKFDYIVIDEIASLIPNIFSPIESYDTKNLHEAWYSLVQLLQSDAKILGLDGSIDKRLVKTIAKVSSKKPVFIINKYKPSKTVDIYTKPSEVLKIADFDVTNLTDINKLESKLARIIYKKVQNNHKILISSTSKLLLFKIHNFILGLEEFFEIDSDTVIIAAGTIKGNVNITEHIHKFKRVLYSPSVTTAVDIKGFENKIVYHIVDFPGISSTVNYQMLNRARDVKKVRLITSGNCEIYRSDIKPTKLDFKRIIIQYFKSKSLREFKKRITEIRYEKLYKLSVDGNRVPLYYRGKKTKKFVKMNRRYFDLRRLEMKDKYLIMFLKAYGDFLIETKTYKKAFELLKKNKLLIPDEVLHMAYYFYYNQQYDYYKSIRFNLKSKLELEDCKITYR